MKNNDDNRNKESLYMTIAIGYIDFTLYQKYHVKKNSEMHIMKMNLVEKPISLKMDSFYLFPFEITKEDI